MTDLRATPQMWEAAEAIAKVLDGKYAADPAWQSFRAMFKVLSGGDVLSFVPTETPLRVVRKLVPPPPKKLGRTTIVKSYGALTALALDANEAPVTTPVLINYIGQHRELGDPEKAKNNILSTLSKDERFISVPWENGRAWWWAGKAIPTPKGGGTLPWDEK